MDSLKKALQRFDHYMQLIPVNSELSVSDEIEFAKKCAISECDEIIRVNTTLKEYYEQVIIKIEAIK